AETAFLCRQLRMLQMEFRRVLIRAAECQHFLFSVKRPEESDAYRSARTAIIADHPVFVFDGGRRVVSAKTIGQNQCWMAGEIRHRELLAIRRRNNHVVTLERFGDRLHREEFCAIRLHVFHGGNKARDPERVRPTTRRLIYEKFVAPGARQLIKCRGGFNIEDRHHRLVRKLRQFDSRHLHAHLVQFLQCSIVEFLVVFRGLDDLFFLLIRRTAKILYAFLQRGAIKLEFGFEEADAEFPPVLMSVPTERGGVHGTVLAVRAMNRVERERAIFYGAADGAKLVLAPRKSHGARARHMPKRWTQSRHAAARARRRNRAQRFGANRESDATRGRRRRWSGGRAARALVRIPRIARDAAKPMIAVRKRAERQLR